ncbi:YceK/YidQ family lipoprotein [Oceanicoccus sp. KOV_DT_Chl]|uniref:YceK/YidQ family lipoprotein n=1 Tax=Oceanicoccus sp. KOV_DT_Chl TaxID=1904639 RepID=UPI00135B5BDD|nr:YceK/YidQ family lipoprotein [Oceanicoccus sp. KOV_DT_Chl]
MTKKHALTAVSVILLSGCGSLTVLTNSDQDVAENLKKQKTYCTSLLRVSGGVSYNLCKLHSYPERNYIDWYLAFYFFDTALSAVTDTVVLPYSIYLQVEEGNMPIGAQVRR